MARDAAEAAARAEAEREEAERLERERAAAAAAKAEAERRALRRLERRLALRLFGQATVSQPPRVGSVAAIELLCAPFTSLPGIRNVAE